MVRAASACVAMVVEHFLCSDLVSVGDENQWETQFGWEKENYKD